MSTKVTIPPVVVDELVCKYDAGKTINGLVEQYPYSYRKIRQALLDAGVTLGPPKVQLPPTPPGFVARYKYGMSIRQLGKLHGMSYNQARNILLAEGVALRGRGQST